MADGGSCHSVSISGAASGKAASERLLKEAAVIVGPSANKLSQSWARCTEPRPSPIGARPVFGEDFHGERDG